MRVTSLIAAGAVLAGALLLIAPRPPAPGAASWEDLVAPYSRGAELPGGFHLARISRGAGDVIILATRADGARIEVHAVRRGQWPGVLESRSFGIAYEAPHTTAPEGEAMAVTRAVAEVIRARDGGLAAPDQLPLTADDHAALPWWLGVWRGGRGALLGVDAAALALLVLIGGAATAVLGGVVAALDVAARVLGPPPLTGEVPGWCLLAGAALLLSGAGRPAVSRRAAAGVALIFALALALRLTLGFWGPLRINGLGPLWIAGAIGADDGIATYGSGYRAVFGPIASLGGASPDWAIFAANAVLSALLAPLTWALARRLGARALAAALAALAIAVDPVAVVSAATESYFPLITVLCVTAALVLAAAARAYDDGRVWRAAAAITAAALLLAQAARVHPVAWSVITAVPFVVLAPPQWRWSRARLLGAAVLMIGGTLAITTGTALIDVLVNVRSGRLMTPPAPPSLRPLPLVAVLATAYIGATRRTGLGIAAAAALIGLLLSRHVYGQSALWQQAYDRLYVTVPAIAVAAAIPAAWQRAAALLPIAGVLALAVWGTAGRALLTARTTDQLEDRWLREQLAALPPECRIIHVAWADKRNLMLPTYVGLPRRDAVGINPAEPASLTRALAPGPCIYYVHGSLCASREGGPACAAVERRLRLTPRARAAFPARPSNEGLPYDTDVVEVRIDRVDAIDPPDAGP
jgi:hypothetical protein